MEAVQFLMKVTVPTNNINSNSFVQVCCHLDSLIYLMYYKVWCVTNSLFGSSVHATRMGCAVQGQANSGSYSGKTMLSHPAVYRVSGFEAWLVWLIY